jgi:hypothetical protein
MISIDQRLHFEQQSFSKDMLLKVKVVKRREIQYMWSKDCLPSKSWSFCKLSSKTVTLYKVQRIKSHLFFRLNGRKKTRFARRTQATQSTFTFFYWCCNFFRLCPLASLFDVEMRLLLRSFPVLFPCLTVLVEDCRTSFSVYWMRDKGYESSTSK